MRCLADSQAALLRQTLGDVLYSATFGSAFPVPSPQGVAYSVIQANAVVLSSPTLLSLNLGPSMRFVAA